MLHNTYTLDAHQGTLYQSQFIRLVSNEENLNSATGNPVLVQPGDVLSVTYRSSSGQIAKQIQVGRPATEESNGEDQSTHDIREVKLNIIVFRNARNTGPYATRDQVEQDIEFFNESMAQSTIRAKVVPINMGYSDQGVPLPTGFGINWKDGMDAFLANGFRVPSPEEEALLKYKDTDPNSIDILYGPNVDYRTLRALKEQGDRPLGYAVSSIYNIPQQSSIFILPLGVGMPGNLAHEVLHILLPGRPHVTQTRTALLAANAYPESKRIGPYPDVAGTVYNRDTFAIREAAETLPQSSVAGSSAPGGNLRVTAVLTPAAGSWQIVACLPWSFSGRFPSYSQDHSERDMLEVTAARRRIPALQVPAMAHLVALPMRCASSGNPFQALFAWDDRRNEYVLLETIALATDAGTTESPPRVAPDDGGSPSTTLARFARTLGRLFKGEETQLNLGLKDNPLLEETPEEFDLSEFISAASRAPTAATARRSRSPRASPTCNAARARTLSAASGSREPGGLAHVPVPQRVR